MDGGGVSNAGAMMDAFWGESVIHSAVHQFWKVRALIQREFFNIMLTSRVGGAVVSVAQEFLGRAMLALFVQT